MQFYIGSRSQLQRQSSTRAAVISTGSTTIRVPLHQADRFRLLKQFVATYYVVAWDHCRERRCRFEIPAKPFPFQYRAN